MTVGPIRALTGVLTLPVTTAHEATHISALYPWLERWDYHIDARRARVFYDASDDAPRAALMFGSLAPTVVGMLVAALVALAWALGGFSIHPPAEIVGWAKLAIACVAWGTYTVPSPQDCRGAWSA